MSAALLLAATLALDPCAPVAASGPPDPAAAREYRAVGDEERAAGRRDPAAAAYRAALSHDPADAAARAGLVELCREQEQQGGFDRGLRLMRRGDCTAAVPAFEAARATGADRAAALLEGICLYQLGADERAALLLREAETDAGSRDSARFFLGLVALRQGRSDEAISLLEASSDDRRLAPLAQDLMRTARRQGKLVLSMLLEAGWDSNVELAPGGSATAAGRADGLAGTTAALSYAPLGESGPFAGAAAIWREQLRADAFDLLGAAAGAGWQIGRGRRHALVAYGHDYRNLGGAPYLSAHRLLAEGRIGLGEAWSAGAAYSVRVESFRTPDSRDYSGLHHAGEADLTSAPGDRWAATLAWRGGRDQARLASLSWWEHGPRLSLRKAFGARTRAGLEAAWTWRVYDTADPVLQVVRRDGTADASALVEVDVDERWTLRFAATGRWALSSVADFRYTKLVPTVGLAYARGLL